MCSHLKIVRKFANNNVIRVLIMQGLQDVITDEQKKAARYAKAMGHPIRLYVLELLSSQSCCYSGDLSEILPVAKSTLSQHLKELKDAGLIQGEIEAPRIKYCINNKNWEEARRLLRKLLR
jgi:ArsR family transcriptional regulator